jgi:hypothetical protein
MIAPLRLFDETSLVHCRLSSSAAFSVRSDGMSGGCVERFQLYDRGPLPGPVTNTNEARRPEGSDTAGVPNAAESSGG